VGEVAGLVQLPVHTDWTGRILHFCGRVGAGKRVVGHRARSEKRAQKSRLAFCFPLSCPLLVSLSTLDGSRFCPFSPLPLCLLSLYIVGSAVILVLIGLVYCVSGLACQDDRPTAVTLKEGGWTDPDGEKKKAPAEPKPEVRREERKDVDPFASV
jgi:hypothetical protein